MVIILDAGHGEETPGKRSPDGTLREYKYCREIMAEVKKQLEDTGFKVETTVTDSSDIPLMKRCQTVNNYCNKYGTANTLLVSIHNNAAGSGKDWMTARGWSVFISLNGSSKSKKLAEYLTKAAEQEKLKIRRPSPGQHYWMQNSAICRETTCPAVLTENMFQDNKEDVAYLLSDKGRKSIAKLHVNGILNYIKYIQS